MVVCSFFLLKFIDTNISPMLDKYINMESERIVTGIVTNSVNGLIKDNFTDYLEITKNDKDDIKYITYNTKEVNSLLEVINKSIQEKLIELEEGKTTNLNIATNLKRGNFNKVKRGVVYEIPFGSLNGFRGIY